jgi:hypothetical protein
MNGDPVGWIGLYRAGNSCLRWTYQDSKGFDPDDLVAKSYGTYQAMLQELV